MKTHSFFNKILVVTLATVFAFVCVARPLQAKADSASMDYVETDLSTNDVKALFTGASAIVPAAIMIIGFIVMCYCVLRNVEVPLSFSSQTSFTDKLTLLGQYAIDNATDDIKDFLYSVYTYCNDNGITSIWGLTKFVGLQAAKFFGAITNWIGGSLILDRSDIGDGLVNQFLPIQIFSSFNSYSYVDEFRSVFNSVSNVDYLNTFGYFDGYYHFYYNLSIPLDTSFLAFVLSPSPNGNGTFGIFRYVYNENGYYTRSTISASTGSMRYAQSGYGINIAPNLSSYSVSYSYTGNASISFPTSSYYYDINHIVSFLSSFGYPVYGFTSYPNQTLYSSDLGQDLTMNDILNPAVDNVYVPTDVWNIDIVGTWEQIARDISATYDQTERIAAFVGDIPLTLTSAQSYAPTINDAGNYVFPDFGSVWKYPQYFFDTLSGWGMFVGNCLRAVTVDEGGLSWIFYGGFVLLVCGGIIGKILMG